MKMDTTLFRTIYTINQILFTQQQFEELCKHLLYICVLQKKRYHVQK